MRERLASEPSLVEGFVNLEMQIQMNGIDFTLREVAGFGGDAGAIDFDNSWNFDPDLDPSYRSVGLHTGVSDHACSGNECCGTGVC